MNKQPMMKLMTTDEMKIATNRVRCLLTNSSIGIAPYNTPEFRLQNIDDAIRLLTIVRAELEAEVTLNKMMKVA